MGTLYIAANVINNISFSGAGHLQFVYDPGNDSPLRELEVQAPGSVVFGAWNYVNVRPHGGTPEIDETGNDYTTSINYKDEVTNKARYGRVLFPLKQGQNAEQTWELLIKANDALQKSATALGVSISYGGDQNSNTFVRTLLEIVGVTIKDANFANLLYDLDDPILFDLANSYSSRFPGYGRSVLSRLEAEGTLKTYDTAGLVLEGTDGYDFIRTDHEVDGVAKGKDHLSGGKGNDTVYSGYGDDTLDGGEGDDLLFGGGNLKRAVLADIEYKDRVVFESASAGIQLRFALVPFEGEQVLGVVAVDDGTGGTDTLIGFEEIEGTDFDDTFEIENLKLMSGFGEANYFSDDLTPNLLIDGKEGQDVLEYKDLGTPFDPSDYSIEDGELVVAGVKFVNIEAIHDTSQEARSFFNLSDETRSEFAEIDAEVDGIMQVRSALDKADKGYESDGLYLNITNIEFVSYGGVSEIHAGAGADFVAAGQANSDMRLYGGVGNDVMLLSAGLGGAIVSGDEGDDWVFAFGAEGARTVGGTGRDWIFNTTRGGTIYGDTTDGILIVDEQPIRTWDEHNELDTPENSDLIWWFPRTTMWDPQKNDILEFYGIPLVGGSNDLPLAMTQGLMAIGGTAMSTFTSPLFYDQWMPFMSYYIDRENGRLGVLNIFDDLGYDQILNDSGVENPDHFKGAMLFENFDEAYGVMWGGHFYEQSGEDGGGLLGNLFGNTNEIRGDLIGDLNMSFKIANPILQLMSWIPAPGIGAITRTLPLIDDILTKAFFAKRLVKASKWVPGADPLILDLDGDGIELVALSESNVFFDIDGDFFAERTGWVESDDGILVHDAGDDGIILDNEELFGSLEQWGFDELAIHDVNGDGVIDASDVIYSELQVWRDLDQDGEADAGELFGLEELGIVSIRTEGVSLDHTTPQGTYINRADDVLFDDGSYSRVFEAIFEYSDTDTIYRGEAGVPAWLDGLTVGSKGYGLVTDLQIAMTNDPELAEIATTAAAQMVNPDLFELRQLSGESLGHWGLTLNLSRELTPVLTAADSEGHVTLADRAIWTEDGTGGYWVLASGLNVMDGDSALIARPTLQDIMAQATTQGQVWQLEQMWSPASRAEALQHREAAPYLAEIINDRVVVHDYGVEQPDGSWQLASGTNVTDVDGLVISSPSVADITSMAAGDGQHWRVEDLGHNPLAGIEVAEIGVNFIDGIAVDYTVELIDRDGTFHVWARNLDRALELQDKFGTPREFNLRNYEINFGTLDEVNSTDDSTYRVEKMTPAQFNFALSLIGVELQPRMLSGSINELTGVIDYSVNDAGDTNFATDPNEFDSGIDTQIQLVGQMMTHYIQMSRTFAVRMGMQGGLSQYFEAIQYNAEDDSYSAATDREMAPVFEAIFADMPAGYDAGYEYLVDWNEILGQVYPDYSLAKAANIFGTGMGLDQRYIMQNMLPAWEAMPGDLDLRAALNALGVDETRLVDHDAAATDVDGTAGRDFIYLSSGDQTYRGGNGADVYFVGGDFGTDFIIDVDDGDADELRLTDIKSTEVIATRDGQDLILTVEGRSDVLRVENQFLGELNPSFGNRAQDTGVKTIVFADGVVWDTIRLAAAVAHHTDGDDVIVGSGSLDVLSGGLGNDVLRGGAGGDFYLYERGSGQDVISEDNSASRNPMSAGLDFLQFVGADITVDDLKLTRYGEGVDLHITLLDTDGNETDDTLLIEKMFDGIRLNLSSFLQQAVDPSLKLDYIAPNVIERFLFEDGGSLDFTQITQRVLESAKTEGSDPIYGFLRADTLDGGAGDDLLVGREGGDVYIYGRDYGLDNIEDGDFSMKLFEGVSIPSVTGASAASLGLDTSELTELLTEGNKSEDILEFADDLRWTDFDFLRDGASDNLTLQISGTTDGVVLTDFLRTEPFRGFINRIEQFVFGDGTIWHYTQLLQHYVDTARTEGDDTIYGFLTSDTLDGGLGDDRLEGQGGNDTYIVRPNEGSDVIFDAGGADKVVIEGIALADVDISRTDLDLIFTLRDTGETITFENQYLRLGAQSAAIEAFVFSDQVIDFTLINPEDIDRIGTSAAEELYGSNFAEIIDGLGGNDTLVGGSDGDTYRFGIGYGHDLIIDKQEAAAWKGRLGTEVETGDRISFGADVSRDMVTFTKDGDDLLITLNGHPDTLRVRNQFSDVVYGVEYFDFTDSPTLLISDVEELLQIVGGNRGDNFIEGTPDQPNVLDGRQGDDTLVGGAEGDSYAFGIGYDFDEIREQSDSVGILDRVVFGTSVTADALILRRSGDDLLIDLGNGSDVLSIIGGLAANTVEEFLFADGSTLTLEEIRVRMLLGSPGDDQLIGFDDRADTLDGGQGSDALIGGTGDDTYRFGYGGGQDEIIDTGGIDRLEFGIGLRPGHFRYSDADGDLLLELIETGESIVIIGGVDTDVVDRFVFEDGLELSMQDMRDQLFNAQTLDGSNIIDATQIDPIWSIEPGTGTDRVLMGEGTRVVFSQGDGMDVVVLPDTVNAAEIVIADFASTQVVVRKASSDDQGYILDFSASGDQIILARATQVSTIPAISFSDGVVWGRTELLQAFTDAQTSEFDDVVTGSSVSETIEGGTGHDNIQGGAGDDTYLFARGDGEDVIADSSGVDTLVLSGYAAEEVTVSRPNQTRDDIILTFEGTNDRVTLRYLSDQGVESVQLPDGTVWSKDDLFARSIAQATAFDDTIVGSDTDDTLNGLEGNDRLELCPKVGDGVIRRRFEVA